MTAKIIKLDEYLEEYKWSIVRAVAYVMGLNPEDPNEVKKADQMMAYAAEKKFAGDIHELQTNLVAALEAKDDEAVKGLLRVQDNPNEAFNGVDIAEGYNFRCQMANEMSKNQLMDWLEETGVDYLIDNDGRFAIKCPDRNSHYHVSRRVEHFSNKWDRGPVQKTVDPTARVKGLTNIERSNGLYDNVTEIAGTHPVYAPGFGKGIELGIGPSMFPADKKKKHRYLDDPKDKVREDADLPDSSDSVKVILQNFRVLAGKVRMVPDPSVEYVWLVVDDKRQLAWIVYIKEKDVEDVDYTESVSKYFNKPGQTVWEGKKKKKTAKQREKAAREKLEDPEETAKAASGQEDPAKKLQDPQFKHQVVSDKKKEASKKEARKKVNLGESAQIEEAVLGMINLPTVARMKELAGLEITQKPESVTTVEVVPVENSACVANDESALALATSRLDDVFKIYDMLNTSQKEEFRLILINVLMKGGVHLRESDELLKELERPEPTGQLTRKDRTQIAHMLRKYWRGMAIDADNWKHKTTKLAPLEQVIILLRKLENRIGQGMP